MTHTLTLLVEPADSARSMLCPLCDDLWTLVLVLCGLDGRWSLSALFPATCCASAINRRKAGAVSAACSRSLLMIVSGKPARVPAG